MGSSPPPSNQPQYEAEPDPSIEEID